MKVLTASQMSQAEKKAIDAGASGDVFMQNASQRIAGFIEDYLQVSRNLQRPLYFFVGQGNNGGDALCVASILQEKGFTTYVYHLAPDYECSPLCQKYYKKYLSLNRQAFLVSEINEITFDPSGIIIDGIYGTGFRGSPPDFLIKLFSKINQSSLPILSIDIPSGLNGETGEVVKSAINADYTLFLGAPKLGFFFKKGYDHVGKLVYVNFGIDPLYLKQQKSNLDFLIRKEVKAYLPKIISSRHKYQAGFVLGITGSKGMMGASHLSGMGALKSGAGIVKLAHLNPSFNEASNYPELIHLELQVDSVDKLLELFNRASSFYLGPGLGTSKQAIELVVKVLSEIDQPCVLDADAINIIAHNKLKIPKNSVLTPHHGEMERLLGEKYSDLQLLLRKTQSYSNQYEVIIVLKGGPTFILAPNQTPVVCTKGDPGMATAGSGDVLTGVIAGLLAQGVEPLNAAKLGVFLHGLSAEIAVKKRTSYSLVASDLIKFLPRAFAFLCSHH